MPRFFLPSSCFDGVNAANIGNNCASDSPDGSFRRVVITGEDARHISKSLRMKVGEQIVLCDMRMKEYGGIIEEICDESVTVRIVSVSRSQSELPCFVTLYQALPKSDKMDYIIQKAVELGACRIVPVQSERCIAKIDSSNADKKISRWQKIAKEASGQCGRGIICEVAAPMGFEAAIDCMKRDALYFACYEGDVSLTLKDILPARCPESLSFFIGPEGGISFNEAAYMRENNIPLCGLGKRILRTETASLCVLSDIGFTYEL